MGIAIRRLRIKTTDFDLHCTLCLMIQVKSEFPTVTITVFVSSLIVNYCFW